MFLLYRKYHITFSFSFSFLILFFFFSFVINLGTCNLEVNRRPRLEGIYNSLIAGRNYYLKAIFSCADGFETTAYKSHLLTVVDRIMYRGVNVNHVLYMLVQTCVMSVGDSIAVGLRWHNVTGSIRTSSVAELEWFHFYKDAYIESEYRFGPQLSDICLIFNGTCPDCVFDSDNITSCSYIPAGVTSDDALPDYLKSGVPLLYNNRHIVTTFYELKKTFSLEAWTNISVHYESRVLTLSYSDVYYHQPVFDRGCFAACLSNLAGKDVACNLPSRCGYPQRIDTKTSSGLFSDTYSELLFSFSGAYARISFRIFDIPSDGIFRVSFGGHGDIVFGDILCGETYASHYCDAGKINVPVLGNFLAVHAPNGSWAVLPKICRRYMVAISSSYGDQLPVFVSGTYPREDGSYCFNISHIREDMSLEHACHQSMHFHDYLLDALADRRVVLSIYYIGIHSGVFPRPIAPIYMLVGEPKVSYHLVADGDVSRCVFEFHSIPGFADTAYLGECIVTYFYDAYCVPLQDHTVSFVSSWFNVLEGEIFSILDRVLSFITSFLGGILSKIFLQGLSVVFSVIEIIPFDIIVSFVIIFVFAFSTYLSLLHAGLFTIASAIGIHLLVVAVRDFS